MNRPQKKKVTSEGAEFIAAIAGLDVDAARAAELAPQIQSLRDSIDAMDEIDLTGVEPVTTFVLRQE